jgi:hypothetical protein
MIDEDIRAALDVDPSPEFVAQVRTRIATEEAPSAWRWSWGVAIASALVASAVLVVFVSRQQTRPSTSVAGTAVAASDNRPASDAPTLERNDSVPRSEASGRRSKTVARQGGAVSRQARSLATETNALTMRTERSEPEILIDPREASALLQLITGVRDGRIDLRAAQTIASPAPAEVEPVAAIVIAPITIEPIAPMLGAGGVRP